MAYFSNGEDWGPHMGLYLSPGGRCDLRTTVGPWGTDADTPADLLRAMLEALT